MSTSLIDEKGLESAAQFALEAEARGDRFLKEIGVQQIIEAYLKGIPEKAPDYRLQNILKCCESDLQANKPVLAWTWLKDAERHLAEKGII